MVPGTKIKPIRTQARSATILPSFVGLKFQVYNGKIYNDVVVTEDMVGHKLGEFSPYVTLRPISPGVFHENQLLLLGFFSPDTRGAFDNPAFDHTRIFADILAFCKQQDEKAFHMAAQQIVDILLGEDWWELANC